MKTLILTRSHEDNKNIINQLFKTRTEFDISQYILRIIESPLLEIQNLTFDNDLAAEKIAKSDAIIISSRNAVDALDGICPKDKLIYVVGEATAQTLQAAGFQNIAYVAKDMADLSGFLREQYRNQAVFCYLRGVYVSFDIAAWCAIQGFSCHEIQVYDSVAAIEFLPLLQDFMDGEEPACVVFFSRRAAQSFINIAAMHGFKHRISAIKALCISASVLESVEHVFENCGCVASSPDLQGMADLILEHFKDR